MILNKAIAVSCIFSTLFVFSLFSQKNKKEDMHEIIQDRNFENGILIQGNNSAFPAAIDSLKPFGNNSKSASWALPQWGSRHVLQAISPITKNDTIRYGNKAKRISFIRNQKQATEIQLEVFASKEYEKSRTLNEEWTHLLLEQQFENPVKVTDLDSLVYKTHCKLLFCENKMNADYNPDLHTAQISQFFIVQNRNNASANYGDFFWFGLPIYDYRYRYIEQYAAKDIGKSDATNKFIFSVASEKLFNGTLHDNEQIFINRNILPYIAQAFQTAKQRGYLTETSFDDLYITAMNIGWEVPGTFDCGIVFETPSLIAYNHQ